MSVVGRQQGAPPDARDTATAVLRLLHPLDAPTRLAVLALASRVLRTLDRGGCHAKQVRIKPGQSWVSPVLRAATREILERDGDEVTYRTRRGRHTVPVPAFRTWAVSTGARPI